MTSGYEPVLHALSVEPQVAHPGQEVGVVFRTRNLGGTASPAGAVHFLLPAGFEPLRAEDARAPVAPAAPGAEVVARIVARVRAPVDDGTRLAVQAALEIGGAFFGTNVCTVVACSRPVLDGPRSGVFVEAIDLQTVRVRTVVTNEGDGPAGPVRIVVPAPPGTERCEESPRAAGRSGDETCGFARIDAGKTVTFGFDARIVAPIGVVCADGAYAESADGRRCALPARAEVVLFPNIAAPEVVLTAERRRLRIAVAVRNDGWADARDVRIGVRLPATLRLRPDSILVDDAPLPQRAGRRSKTPSRFARLERAAADDAIVLDRVAARSTVRLEGTADSTTPNAGGDAAITLTADGIDRRSVAPFALEPARDVRMRIVGSPRCTSPGEVAAMVVEVLNCGDVVETLAVTVVGDVPSEPVPALNVEPGHAALATLVLRVPELFSATSLCFGALCSDAGGERARVDFSLAVRRRRSGGVRVADAEEGHRHLPIEGVATAVDAVGPASASLAAPPNVSAGAPFLVRASVAIADPVDVLVLHASADRTARYVAGSTTLDGRVVLDRDGTSPLHADGLELRDVPAGTRLTLTWSLIAADDSDEDVRISARCVADGTVVELQPAAVAVRPGHAFPVRPTGLPYHVEARTILPDAVPMPVLPAAASGKVLPDVPSAAAFRAAEMEVIARSDIVPPAAPQRPAERFFFRDEAARVVRLDAVASASLERAMRPAAGNALVSHILALRALVPDLVHADDAAPAQARTALHDAVRDVFDKLAVKLRIPGFSVACTDLEDPAMRRALRTVFALIDEPATTAAIRVSPPSPYEDSPFGAPAALRALVALVPSRCDAGPALAGALRGYAAELDAALAQFDGVALPFFEDALVRDAGPGLSEARSAVSAQLRHLKVQAGAA